MGDMGKTAVQVAFSDVARLILAVSLIAVTGLCLLSDRAVPDVLWALDGAAIGFYFGGLAAAVKC